MTDLGTLVRQPPTGARWAELVRRLASLHGPALIDAIDAARPVLSWPADLRYIGADSRWLAGVFTGARDPRLELVGWASVTHVYEYDYVKCNLLGAQLMGVVAGFARHLDPTFDPPAVVLDQGNTVVSAYGCGGGEIWEKRGDATRGVLFQEEEVEHAADAESTGKWVAYGLAEGCQLTIRRHDYIGGKYWFDATGPSPAVLEVAALWGKMTRTRMEDFEVLAQLPRRA